MKMPLKLIMSISILLGGCSSLTIEPSKMSAENDCSSYSANLSQYNACLERVDANFRAYEQQKRLEGEDGY